MPSKRCATSAKRSENCSSAPVTNRMACQSRCEIWVQASHRRLLSACSRPSTPRNRAVWGLGSRSAGRLSKRITDDCGRALTCHVAPHLNSPCLPIQTLHRDWCLGASAACLVRLKAIALAATLLRPALILPDGQITESCPAPPQKIFRFSADPNQLYNSRRLVPTRGALRGRHGRWERDAMDAAASGTQVLDEGC